MIGNDYKEQLEDGKLLLFVRNAIFQARVYIGNGKYIHRSLKTSNKGEARKKALRLLHETEYKQSAGLPIKQLTMSQLIDEYVAVRQKQYDQSLLSKQKITSSNESISVHMLRQIKRVVKFWREYCGTTALAKIDNAVLQGYIPWRKDYYHRMPKESIPRNAKPNPADKTLQWEMTLGKTMLKYAHERGYRGAMQLPTYSFTGVKKIVRPAFTLADYTKLLKAMRRSIDEVNEHWRKYPRLLLRDYVLILSNSGMRVGELNNLQWGDIERFVDDKDRPNYRLFVNGKTGRREVIPRTNTVRYIDRMQARNPDRNPNEFVFRMREGGKVITLIDQFQAVLKSAGILENRDGERYTLYSLRHFYAVRAIRKGKPIWDISKNMGTSVKIIENYYGRQATAGAVATALGG